MSFFMENSEWLRFCLTVLWSSSQKYSDICFYWRRKFQTTRTLNSFPDQQATKKIQISPLPKLAIPCGAGAPGTQFTRSTPLSS